MVGKHRYRVLLLIPTEGCVCCYTADAMRRSELVSRPAAATKAYALVRQRRKTRQVMNPALSSMPFLPLLLVKAPMLPYSVITGEA